MGMFNEFNEGVRRSRRVPSSLGGLVYSIG